MRIPSVLLLALLFAACNTSEAPSLDIAMEVPEAALTALDSAAVREHIVYLSSDELEGRGTGTRGEQMTIEYISARMQETGLQPAGDNGTFFQAVPLLGSTPRPAGPLVFRHENGQEIRLNFIEQFIASTDLEQEHVATTGELVFVGYGIDAPGYNWDDYKGVDVQDKILVMFVNDPPSTTEEPNLFQADTLTYNGRWTYKQEEARRKGAKGVILIHTTEMAGYPFTVLSGSAAGEQIQLATPPENPLEMKGWITQEAGQQLAQMAGTTLEAWLTAARTRDFQPQELPITASLEVNYTVRRFSGTNVIGKLPGRVRPEEAVIYTAHHDHMGIGVPVAGDSIYNGAVDNATGIGMLLNLADAFSRLPEAPERSVLFASVSAEESGLLGAEYYAQNPHLPLSQTVANINVDSGNIFGRSNDIVGIGAERSDMLRILTAAAAAESMTVSPDPQPNQGLFFRSDQLAFARGGVPAVFINTGESFVGQPQDYFERVEGAYNTQHYHQPSDEFDPAWPLGGLVQQMRVAFRIGYQLANSDLWPEWKPSEAFAEVRGSRN
jgi:Zn-dependent M28 family amino/carboxypeptidase